MKKAITQPLLILALSFCTFAGLSQCVTVTGLTVTQGTNGTASIQASVSSTTTPGQPHFYWNVTPAATQTSGYGLSHVSYQFPSNGTYTVCVSYIDSLNSCTSSSCTPITISNMSTFCNAAFSFYNDSTCGTHFINASTGSGLTYKWYDMSSFTLLSNLQNPVLTLGNGSHLIGLYTYASGQFCDSAIANVNVNCSTNTACHAGFSYYTDSTTCLTNFVSSSTGTSLSYEWYDMNGLTLLSTQQNPSLNLANGYYTIGLYTYSSGVYCDSASAGINIYCPNSGNPVCQANAQFSIFSDSLNPGQYFAYNQSTGNGTISYLWDFGDGSTSTQMYPFHQYATPGQYIICLTIAVTNNSLTCTDTYCDSSSVHRISSGFFMSSFQAIAPLATSLKQEQSGAAISVYPNPMENELMIDMDKAEAGVELEYVITDALGKVVSKNSLTESKTTVNTSSLERGFYVISIIANSSKTLKTIKVVK